MFCIKCVFFFFWEAICRIAPHRISEWGCTKTSIFNTIHWNTNGDQPRINHGIYPFILSLWKESNPRDSQAISLLPLEAAPEFAYFPFDLRQGGSGPQCGLQVLAGRRRRRWAPAHSRLLHHCWWCLDQRQPAAACGIPGVPPGSLDVFSWRPSASI